MHEVFRDWDHESRVGGPTPKSEGFHTALRNWTGSNITEVPIPDMFPNACVLNHEDFVLVTDYFHAQPQASEEWECPNWAESGRRVFEVGPAKLSEKANHKESFSPFQRMLKRPLMQRPRIR